MKVTSAKSKKRSESHAKTQLKSHKDERPEILHHRAKKKDVQFDNDNDNDKTKSSTKRNLPKENEKKKKKMKITNEVQLTLEASFEDDIELIETQHQQSGGILHAEEMMNEEADGSERNESLLLTNVSCASDKGKNQLIIIKRRKKYDIKINQKKKI